MLPHDQKMIGKAFHFARGQARTGYCQVPASTGVGILAAGLSNDLTSNRARTYAVLWLYHEYLLGVGCGVVSGG